MFKIWEAKAIEEDNNYQDTENGTIVIINKTSIVVKTSKGLLELFEVQLEGKKRMFVEDFLRGYQVNVGDVFI